MELSIIIVNYNGIKYLKNCLDSIYQYLSDISFEIIIFDNNSSDNSIEFIKKEYPQVILIESRKNLGFGKGNNLAAKKAKGSYLLLLNNDTILLSSLTPLLKMIKKDNTVGAIGIKMLNKKKEYLCSTGRFPKWYNVFLLKNLQYIIKEPHNKIISVEWIEGSFIIIPKIVWKKIQGFSEDYFMYAEDIDLCKKISNLGYKRLFYPFASYIHFVGFKNSRNKQLIKSLKIYCEKNMFFIERIIAKTLLTINYLVKK